MADTNDRETPKIPEPIPGEHDASTLTTRESGGMSGRFNGGDAQSVAGDVDADAATREEWARDGGGSPGARRAGREAGHHWTDDRTGSQTGTVGGGGADAHNPSPNRATGQDDPSVKPGR